MRFLLRKITQSHIRQRILRERLAEPLHLNAWAALLAVFSSYRRKIDFDLILRAHNAFAINEAVRAVRWERKTAATIVEFGVAAGAGLINMAKIAQRIGAATRTKFRVVGFDTGQGMPSARDYRDHPELYWEGNYPMDEARLRAALPSNAELILGELSQTVPQFLAQLSPDAPIAYVVLDLDYYWSTVEALKIFDGSPESYLPVTRVYVDDIDLYSHNRWCGALAALDDFNTSHSLRKLERDEYLVHQRYFKHAAWISHMWKLHILDHPRRNDLTRKTNVLRTQNPYL